VLAANITVLATLQRMQRFMDTNGDTLGEINTSRYRRILNDVIDPLSSHAVTQAASKRVGTRPRLGWQRFRSGRSTTMSRQRAGKSPCVRCTLPRGSSFAPLP
jgi:hypothetical protein